MCDLIFSGVFERHPHLTLAIVVEFELAWAPHLLSTMDYTYRERHGEAIYPSRTACSRVTSSAATSCCAIGIRLPSKILVAVDGERVFIGGIVSREKSARGGRHRCLNYTTVLWLTFNGDNPAQGK